MEIRIAESDQVKVKLGGLAFFEFFLNKLITGEIMKKLLISVGAILFSFMILGQVSAAGETEFILEKKITAMTPIFMLNHIGDPDWIKGFQVEGDIFLKGGDANIGRFTGEVLLVNPPMNPAGTYDYAYMTILNVMPGLGSYTVTANSLALGSSAQNGDIVMAWSGSISNGIGILENNFGLSAGNGVVNVFAGEGTMTEVLNIRNGF